MEKQRTLVRVLYRKLIRESQRIPNEACLLHLNLPFSSLGGGEDGETVQSAIRKAFRATSTDQHDTNERIQHAMEGLRMLYSLDVENLPLKRNGTNLSNDSSSASTASTASHSFSFSTTTDPQKWLQQVEWLDPLPEMNNTNDTSEEEEAEEAEENNNKNNNNDDPIIELPVFPLSGPLFPDEGRQYLPVVSQFSDVPVSGMEIPLKIFEPRYRQMYNDLFGITFSSIAAATTKPTETHSPLSSSSSSSSPTTSWSKSFVVPFGHPYRPGQFAKYGWLYKIMQVQDVADQTNGRFHFVCNHLVTKPVQIHDIVNPHQYHTQSTYLRARVTVLDDDGDDDSLTTSRQHLQPLESLLRKLRHQLSTSSSSSSSSALLTKSLVDRLLMALAEGCIWPVAQIWILNLQMKILDLQVKISNEIQRQALQAWKSRPLQHSDLDASIQGQGTITKEMILVAQEPHREALESMLMEVATLVPLLLQDSSPGRQCQRLCERIQERLGS
jgi:Lon protease-like protein